MFIEATIHIEQLSYCVRNVTVDKRNTLLAERLAGKVSQGSIHSLPPSQQASAASRREEVLSEFAEGCPSEQAKEG